MTAIRQAVLGGILGFGGLCTPVAAASLSPEAAVRLFLGAQAQSPVTVEAIEPSPGGVTVKGFSTPLGPEADAPRLRVAVLQFTGIVPGESDATFDVIVGSGITLSGAASLSAGSMMLTDVKVKDLGTKPLSVAVLDNLLVKDIVLAGQARLESYSASMTGSLASSFSGTVRIQGIQPSTVDPSADRFDVSLDYRGDGQARSLETRYAATQTLIGVVEGEARWSDVNVRSGSASPLARFDLFSSLRDANLVAASLALQPGPNGRMLLRVLPRDQRDQFVALGRTFLQRDGSVPAATAASVAETLGAFAARPDRLVLSARPSAPVPMARLLAGSTTQGYIDLLGLTLTQASAP